MRPSILSEFEDEGGYGMDQPTAEDALEELEVLVDFDLTYTRVT
jgi:hypothetical protein